MTGLPEGNVSEQNLLDMVTTAVNKADWEAPGGTLAAFKIANGDQFVIFVDDEFGQQTTWRLRVERTQ